MSLHVITGPMRSGKTAELIRLVRQARAYRALIDAFDDLIRTPRRLFEEAIDAIDLALLKARGESDGN